MRCEPQPALPTGSHLSDDQLVELYVFAGENAHLSACRLCASRFAELARSLQHVHDAAASEADTWFTAERLQAQRERIVRRIERHDHPAEVVAFPQRTPSHPAVHRLLGPARRWVAGAAAAGLAAGLFLGFAMDRRMHDAVEHVSARTVAAPARPNDGRDDLFFLEVEAAIVGSRVRDMRPDLDAIDLLTTPVEIREVSYLRE